MKANELRLTIPPLLCNLLQLALPMVAILGVRSGVPKGGSGGSMDMDSVMVPQLTDKNLDLAARERWQNLPKLFHFRSNRLIVLDVLQQQGLVRFPVKPTPARVNSAFSKEAIEAAGLASIPPSPMYSFSRHPYA
jgi:hypothetical protein